MLPKSWDLSFMVACLGLNVYTAVMILYRMYDWDYMNTIPCDLKETIFAKKKKKIIFGL